jgi:hypothetical protein
LERKSKCGFQPGYRDTCTRYNDNLVFDDADDEMIVIILMAVIRKKAQF